MMNFEAKLKETSERKKHPEPVTEFDKGVQNVKRAIVSNLIKAVIDMNSEQFKKNLIEVLMKCNQNYKLENNNFNHPTLKNIFKLLGLANPNNVDLPQGQKKNVLDN